MNRASLWAVMFGALLDDEDARARFRIRRQQEQLRLREAHYASTYVQRTRIALLLRHEEPSA